MRDSVRTKACIPNSWDLKIMGVGALFAGHPSRKPVYNRDSETSPARSEVLSSTGSKSSSSARQIKQVM